MLPRTQLECCTACETVLLQKRIRIGENNCHNFTLFYTFCTLKRYRKENTHCKDLVTLWETFNVSGETGKDRITQNWEERQMKLTQMMGTSYSYPIERGITYGTRKCWTINNFYMYDQGKQGIPQYTNFTDRNLAVHGGMRHPVKFQ